MANQPCLGWLSARRANLHVSFNIIQIGMACGDKKGAKNRMGTGRLFSFSYMTERGIRGRRMVGREGRFRGSSVGIHHSSSREDSEGAHEIRQSHWEEGMSVLIKGGRRDKWIGPNHIFPDEQY